jgi:two-component system NarL family response regulator
MATKETFKVLVADDHAIFRKGLVTLLKQVSDFSVVAEAKNGQEAVELYKKHLPDIALLDLEMPQMRGVDAIKAIHAINEDAKIIILTTFDMDEDIQDALKAGAKSYLLKDVDADDLVNTMREVMCGKTLVPPQVAAKLAQRLTQLQLTTREHAVLKLVAEKSMPNKLIADQLGISEATVKTHLTNLFEKLGVTSRTEAIAVAARRGLVRIK